MSLSRIAQGHARPHEVVAAQTLEGEEERATRKTRPFLESIRRHGPVGGPQGGEHLVAGGGAFTMTGATVGGFHFTVPSVVPAHNDSCRRLKGTSICRTCSDRGAIAGLSRE